MAGKRDGGLSLVPAVNLGYFGRNGQASFTCYAQTRSLSGGHGVTATRSLHAGRASVSEADRLPDGGVASAFEDLKCSADMRLMVKGTELFTEVALDAALTSRVRVLEVEPAHDAASVADAGRLVVVGRGIGSKKSLPLMRRLADLLGAELGCTRPLVEAGWLEYRHQVGQTGASVAPELLISVGVSGAIQHLAGIGGAKTVIAINDDPEAPIFGAAQYKVVGDCIEVVQSLVERLEAE